MSPFPGLLRKDILLSKGYFLLWMLILLATYVFGLAIAGHYERFTLVYPFIFALYMFNVAGMPVMMALLLHIEDKTRYWLHNPISSFKLLASKFLVSSFYFVAALILTDLLAWFSLKKGGVEELFSFQQNHLPYAEGFLMNASLLLAAIYFAVWGIFLWSIYHLLAVYPFFKRIRWLIVLGIYIIFQKAVNELKQIPLIEDIMHAWVIRLDDALMYWNYGGMDIYLEEAGIPILPIIVMAVFLCCLFYLSGWLLDRKVEV